MSKTKIIGVVWVVILIVALLPIPLSFIDITFHWLLLVTLPIGAILLLILGVIWLFLRSNKSNKEFREE